MSVSLLPSIIPEFLINGVPATGAQLFTYAAGTTTKLATYTDSTGAVAQTNPIILNARGEPQNTIGNSVGLWLTNSTAYKFVLAPSTDSDPPTNPIWTLDNITAGQLVGNSYTAAGTNAIALTPAANTPTPTSYANYNTYVFSAPATSTGPVTMQVGSLGYLNCYINGTQATTGSLQAGETFIAVYNSALNSGAGGFSLFPSISAVPLVYAAETGAANAYVITPTPVISAYVAGQIYEFIATNANTGASTLNVNSLGAKSILNQAGGALIANQILAGSVVSVVYNGTAFIMQNVNSTGYQGATSIVGGLTLDAFVAASAALASAAQTATGTSTTQAITPSAFAGNINFATPGHIVFPGGLIVNYGVTANIAVGGTAITYDKAFTTSTYAIVALPIYGGAAQAVNVLPGYTVTGCTFAVNAVACPVLYVAIGK